MSATYKPSNTKSIKNKSNAFSFKTYGNNFILPGFKSGVYV